MDIDTLYPLVTEAIRRAEVLDELAAPGAASAHLDVSLLEERIAQVVPASDEEGAIARRGAIQAAIAAGEGDRARALASRYLAEADASSALARELRALLAEVTDPRWGIGHRAAHDDAAPVKGKKPSRPVLPAESLAVLRPDLSASDLMETIVRELKRSGQFTLPSFGTFSVRAADSGKDRGSTPSGRTAKGEKTVQFDPAPALKKAV